ncbi:TPA: tyrosine-type recombinase/integrase [Yersinia enterocolitica]
MANRKFLSRNEVERLLDAIPANKNTARDKCMLLMCFIHGLRTTELRSLRLQDMDLAGNRLNVSRLKTVFQYNIRFNLVKKLPYSPNWRCVLNIWRLIAIFCFYHDMVASSCIV